MRREWRQASWFAVVMLLSIGLIGLLPVSASGEYANPHLLVESEWLQSHLDDPGIVVVDVRGRALYRRAHISGAVMLDGAGSLNDPNGEFAGFLKGPEAFQEQIRNLGISNDSTVVVYDRGNSLAAARFFYALEYYGLRDQVKILNGGFSAWTRSGGTLTADVPDTQPGDFTARPQSELMAGAQEVLDYLGDESVVLLDVRSSAEYAGEDVRADRGGHIPGAININWPRALRDGPVQRFLPPDELRALYERAGVTPDKKIVTYCQTNVRGAHTYFALRLLGYDDIEPYEGSWSEWGNRAELPIE